MEYVLKTKNLAKKYRRFTALDGLTMNVPKGSIYGFVGRNGAGKTTLIRVICGLQNPTGGSYSLYGIDGKSGAITKSRRRTGGQTRDMGANPHYKRNCSAAKIADHT